MIRLPQLFPGRLGELAFLGGRNQLPSAPALATPADGATVGHLAFNPTWTAARRALSYDFQSATDVSITTGVVTTNVAALTLAPGLSAGTYYYRVRARNTFGVSAWSAIQSVILS